MTKLKYLLNIILLFSFVGCTKTCSTREREAMTPEQVVQKYLDISFSMNTIDDRAKLVNLTIGPLREQLETVPDISIAEAFVDKRYLLEEYELVERRDRTPRETEITYRLVYKNLENGTVSPANAPKIETNNTVSVIRYKGAWAIRDVIGKQTSIDFPLESGSVVTPSK